MNAAEITDKLGLHSLRQRAWVCAILLAIVSLTKSLILLFSTFNQLALLLVTVCMRVWNGSAIPLERLDINRWIRFVDLHASLLVTTLSPDLPLVNRGPLRMSTIHPLNRSASELMLG